MAGKTQAERILRAHGQTGYERADGSLRVLSIWTERDGTAGEEWETIPRAELMVWLGY